MNIIDFYRRKKKLLIASLPPSRQLICATDWTTFRRHFWWTPKLRDTSESHFFAVYHRSEDIPFHYHFGCHLALFFSSRRLSCNIDRRSAKSLYRYTDFFFVDGIYGRVPFFHRCSVMWFSHQMCVEYRMLEDKSKGFTCLFFTDKHAPALLFASLNGRLWMKCLLRYLLRRRFFKIHHRQTHHGAKKSRAKLKIAFLLASR